MERLAANFGMVVKGLSQRGGMTALSVEWVGRISCCLYARKRSIIGKQRWRIEEAFKLKHRLKLEHAAVLCHRVANPASHQTNIACRERGFGAGRHVELAVNLLGIARHRVGADAQQSRGLCQGHAFGDDAQHLGLALR